MNTKKFFKDRKTFKNLSYNGYTLCHEVAYTLEGRKGEFVSSFLEIGDALDFIGSIDCKSVDAKEIFDKYKEQYSEANAGKILKEIPKVKDQFTPDQSKELDRVFAPVSDFEKITSGICKVLTEKDKRYGSSALNPLNVFNGKTRVGQRADDKVARIANSPELRKNDVCDLIGYLILMCKENNWMDFSDQID